MINARFVLLFLLLPLAGCALFESKATQAMHASPDYRSGYSDGCNSAGDSGANPNADNRVRDDEAFAGNEAYRTGWHEGFGACRAMARQTGVPDSTLGGGTP